MLNDLDIEEISRAILHAGDRILDHQQNQSYKIKFKAENDPVTTADDEANQIIIDAIGKIFPEDMVISEETYDENTKADIDQRRKNAARIWIIDPLDGTKDFIKGLPYFAVSVGFLLNGKPEFGYIYNPAKKFFLYGGPGYGTRFNHRPFEKPVKTVQSIHDLKICISTSEIKQNLFPELLNVIPEDNIEFIGSVAYKLGLVAAGEFDLILSKRKKSDWDIAAGLALLQSPDMEILDQNFIPVQLNKNSISTNGLIVGSKTAVILYQKFLKELNL